MPAVDVFQPELDSDPAHHSCSAQVGGTPAARAEAIQVQDGGGGQEPVSIWRKQSLPQTPIPRQDGPLTGASHPLQPFSWRAGFLFVATAAGLMYYFEFEKDRMKRKRIAEAAKGVGKPKVGGSFELIDQDGRPMTDQDLKGQYSLVYFGFTHCPDICPEELDKMARMFDLVEEKRPGAVLPVFVTCDPARDDPQALKTYLAEFHPKFIGLTGTYEQIKAMCKAYRVYFSTPSVVKPGQDYLVDHSIYFYLMDPDGDFVEALGRQHSPDQAAAVILDHVKDWRGDWRKKE